MFDFSQSVIYVELIFHVVMRAITGLFISKLNKKLVVGSARRRAPGAGPPWTRLGAASSSRAGARHRTAIENGESV